MRNGDSSGLDIFRLLSCWKGVTTWVNRASHLRSAEFIAVRTLRPPLKKTGRLRRRISLSFILRGLLLGSKPCQASLVSFEHVDFSVFDLTDLLSGT